MTRPSAAKLLFAALAAVLLVGFAVPQFNADRYNSRIQNALQNALGRKVTFGEVRFNLLTGPGFTVRDLTVAEDPALGFEPIAYVDRVVATPRILSLLTGRLAFSSLRLEDAHLNLARADLPNGEYRWNIEPLLRPSLIAAFPNLTIHGARINFKAANVKSVVYLLDSDLAIEPPSGQDAPWHFNFEGKPARADRTAHGSGIVRAHGTWTPGSSKPGSLDADLQLVRSELGDIVAVVRGEDAGLHGLISGNAHFQGPMDRVAVDGHLRVEELHGWDQDVPKGEAWPLDVHGSWNSPRQTLELEARVTSKDGSPLAVRYLVDRYLTQPKWGTTITLAHFPAGPLVPLARHMGMQLPDKLQLGGTLDGVVGYSVAAGYGGQARIEHATLSFPGSKPLQTELAEVLIADGTARLLPTRVTDGALQDATVSASYSLATAISKLQIVSRGLDVSTLGKQIPSDRVPVLLNAHAGQWNGNLIWTQIGPRPGVWTGDAALTAVELPTPALSKSVFLDSAQLQLKDDGSVTVSRMRGHTGAIAFGGEYRYEPEGAHPHRFRITAGPVSAVDLEQLLLPTLARRREVLGVELPFTKQTLPEWLANWHADGTLQFASLKTDDAKLINFRAHAQWDAARVQLTDITAGNLNGSVDLDLRGRRPLYEITGRMRDQEWKGGRITADTQATASGTGPELRNTLEAAGNFRATGLGEDMDLITGHYEANWRSQIPRLLLTAVRVRAGGDLFTGKGTLQPDRSLLLQLDNGGKQGKIAGTLADDAPFRWLP